MKKKVMAKGVGGPPASGVYGVIGFLTAFTLLVQVFVG